jgi:hypothetical protein
VSDISRHLADAAQQGETEFDHGTRVLYAVTRTAKNKPTRGAVLETKGPLWNRIKMKKPALRVDESWRGNI